MTSRATAGRTAAAVLALSAVATLALPAAQGAAPKVRLFSCVNVLFDNEPAALNRCQDGRRLRYDDMTVTDTAIYTTEEREALEAWPVSSDGRIAKGSCYVGYRNDLGCEVVPGDRFSPRDTAVAPDGRHLYVSNFGVGITVFEVGPDGALRYSSCVGTAGSADSCPEHVPGTDGAFMAFALAVSPDGGRLYVTDYRGILTFRRLSGGALEYLGCVKLARSTCATSQNRPFVAEEAEIALSGDSRFVYVMGGGGAADIMVKGQPVEIVSVLERTEGGPGLHLVQELKMPVWGTDRGSRGGNSVALPADGRHLYVTDRNRLATLARNAASGRVSLLRCLGNDEYGFDTRKCMRVRAPSGKGSDVVDEPSDLALTADGRGLAVASDDGLFFLRRNVATGALGALVKRAGEAVVATLACAQTSKASGPCQTDIPFQGWGAEHVALSRRGDRAFTTTFSSQVLASVTAPFAPSARRESGAAVNHRLGLNSFVLGRTRAASKRAYTFAEVPWLAFAFGVDLISEHGVSTDTSEAVRLTLPDGLSWEPQPAWARTLWPAGVPDYWSFTPDAEACEVSGQVATCRADGVPSGTNLFGWILDVTAARAGIYKVTGEVVPPADGRNIPPRGKQTPGQATLTLVVGARSGPVAVGKVVLSRPRPSFVVATVDVKQGGEGVRPGSGTCTATFQSVPAYGKRTYPASLQRGAATCVYGFNNARYAGKTLVGEIAFAVGKRKVKRAFSVRIGSGTSLLAPRGAVLKR